MTYLDPAPYTPTTANLDPPEALHFVLDDKLKSMLNETVECIAKVKDDPDIRIYYFRSFGTDMIKKIGKLHKQCMIVIAYLLPCIAVKVSPDAFIQMALQLTYFTIHGKPTPTYETASTRAYLKGRTETVRSLSMESRAWCEAMRNSDVPVGITNAIWNRSLMMLLECRTISSVPTCL